MGAMGNPKTWVPHMNNRDCSEGSCSLFCPQWCYIVFPPPPPSEFSSVVSGPKFSPLVIAVMGILASAFLLVSYYTIISKYCGSTGGSSRGGRDQSQEEEREEEDLEENRNPSLHEPWQTKMTGLDEALIKTITVFKYKKGDGLIGEPDCAVCLSEFEEDESLRLLPKCSHAFHVQCIDKWLTSHSNCPLCRANIIFITPLPPTPVTETPPVNDSSRDHAITVTDTERESSEQNEATNEMPKSESPSRDLGHFQRREVVIEIKDGGFDQQIRRSFSMDHSCQIRVADVLRDEEAGLSGVGSSKPSSEMEKSGGKKRIKRSFSSGRFFFIRQGGAREAIMPL